MSQLTYNGVTVGFPTSRVSFDPVYDDLAGRDYLYTKITIDVDFVISPGYPPALNGEGAADTMRRVSHLLNKPRAAFTYVAGGQTLVNVTGIDANNGPLASCKITRIVGTEMLACSLQITTFIVDCGGPGGPPYMSNRWTETQDIDECAYSTLTRTGQIVARSDLEPNADNLRALTIPPLSDDFRRTSSQYQLSADGLRLHYTHVDHEEWLMPPNPAAKAEGHMSLTCGDGATFWGEVYLRLQGAKTTDKAVLMRRAVGIALAKLKNAGSDAFSRKGSYVLYCTLTDDLFANDISVRMRAMVQPTTSQLSTLGGSGTTTIGSGNVQGSGGQPPAGSVSPPNSTIPTISTTDTLNWLQIPFEQTDPAGGRFDSGARGTAQLLLTAAALQDPCLRQSVSLSAGQSVNFPSGNDGTIPATISVVATLPDFQGSLRSTSDSGAYDRYLVSQRTTLDPKVLELSTAGKPAIIQTGEATARRRVHWHASRIGAPPNVPDPKVSDSNMVLVKAQVDPGTVGLAADGESPEYKVSGVYDYVFTDPTAALLAAALPPWMSGAAATLATSAVQFASGIIDGISGGAAMKSSSGNLTTQDGGTSSELRSG
jgi:hypothetical protein